MARFKTFDVDSLSRGVQVMLRGISRGFDTRIGPRLLRDFRELIDELNDLTGELESFVDDMEIEPGVTPAILRKFQPELQQLARIADDLDDGPNRIRRFIGAIEMMVAVRADDGERIGEISFDVSGVLRYLEEVDRLVEDVRSWDRRFESAL